MDVSLRARGEDQAGAMAKQTRLLNFNRARRVVRDTQRLAVAGWPVLLEETPRAVRATIPQRLSDLVPARKSS